MALGITGSAGGHEVSQRLAKIETAIFRRKTIVFDYYTMERDEVGSRRVDPYQLLYQGGQFYVVGARTSAAPSASSGSLGSAARSVTRPRPSTTSSVPPTSTRASMPTGSTGSSATRSAVAEIWIGSRIAWQIERHFGHYGEIRAGGDDGDRMFPTRTPTPAS